MKPFDRSIKIAPSILSADFANFGAECRRPIHIEVDGGVTPETAPLVAAAGADVLVAGTAVFKGGSMETPEVYGRNIAAIRAAAMTALSLRVA